MKIGCPAISLADKKAHIDSALCVGCELCGKLCPKNCIG
jgi:indolepyruvate ferredoxin oxidoreductase alpha subunit